MGMTRNSIKSAIDCVQRLNGTYSMDSTDFYESLEKVIDFAKANLDNSKPNLPDEPYSKVFAKTDGEAGIWILADDGSWAGISGSFVGENIDAESVSEMDWEIVK